MNHTNVCAAILLTLPLSAPNIEAAAPNDNSADLAFINAVVYTADAQNPTAQAVAARDGVIIAVGDIADIELLMDENTQVIDVKGGLLLPGFIDNHNHVFEAASSAGGDCELAPDLTPSEQLPYLHQCREASQPDQWVIGWGHTIDATLSGAGPTPLQVIDSVFPDRPVVIMEQTSHSMWVNSVALRLAGINSDTPDPQGGKIMRDPKTGALNGVLVDNAGDIIMEQAWNSLRNKFEVSYDGLLNGLAEAARNGVTTIGDGRLYWKRGWYDVWRAVAADGELTARVSLRPWIYPHVPQQEQLDFLNAIYNPDPNGLLIVNQVKMYSDGILINGTAKVLQPYDFTYFPQSPYGLNYLPQAVMQDWLIKLDRLGYGAHIHAIGDGGVRESLNAIAAARQGGSQRRYNMTHLELVDAGDLGRFKTLQVDADFQVGSDYIGAADHSWAEPLIGEERAHRLIPLAEVYASGANVTLSSDWNVNPISPMAAIANAVQLKERGLPNVRAALNAYTINAATALGLEAITGSIRVGKSADIVVLDRNILDAAPQHIRQARVLMTWLRGKEVYAAE
ncbi:predicted metal-dependent hydrolase with the TIM-barrel fold [Hahella chejuensis KCTC 2396]|uniref:Predicted metal-dependent hydrolase with the TIM-barrel fold n=1 Tax=Hahella chejuensis (strain KCTC 2396) TaxID=349521 RepID=Q2S738_HAHCH|nr:amidohydrolase [Hahella chejuensis]ABC33536.1 predicted metal-dependent hydrolase with the TIM-barrel fold [Hahella chejuensis KCTC 2396]